MTGTPPSMAVPPVASPSFFKKALLPSCRWAARWAAPCAGVLPFGNLCEAIGPVVLDKGIFGHLHDVIDQERNL